LKLYPNTLTSRLFLLSSLAAIIGVIIVALVISSDYRRNAEARLNDLLVVSLFNLMGSFNVDDEGQLMGLPELGDPRYSRFDSGWYWSVEKIDDPASRVSSKSLADQQIIIPEDVPLDQTFQRTFDALDNAGQMLHGMEAQVFLGDSDDLYSFKVTANRNSLNDEISVFSQRLAIVLSIFAFSIVLATYLMVRLGLRPVSRATKMLGEIRSGNAEKIEGQYPEEIQPLITETNALIESNDKIIERARTQVGNLAHSLKTPLAVMQNELQSSKGLSKSLFTEQTQLIRQQVQVYLDRARISARSSTAISRTLLLDVLSKLIMVVEKLNRDTNIESNFPENETLVFFGEEHDLQEIFGNLIENAAKYSKSKVVISALEKNSEIVICVEDDGPGMSEKDIEKAKKRGGRIDEGKTGWGLGLSIVRDIVDEYAGQFELGRSDLGGLKATVFLPGKSE